MATLNIYVDERQVKIDLIEKAQEALTVSLDFINLSLSELEPLIGEPGVGMMIVDLVKQSLAISQKIDVLDKLK
jgi:hypothetical protein